MASLAGIIEAVVDNHPQADAELIERAYAYAAHAQNEPRNSLEDRCFVHRVAVADILANMRLDAATVCSALLHDVVENGIANMGEIHREFGADIAFLVDGVTRLDKFSFLPYEDRDEDEEAESFRKMLLAASSDIRVVLVKLAERLDSMRTLGAIEACAQKRTATETLEIYAPLAERLGIQWLKAELQDLSFRYLEPEAFSALEATVSSLAESTDHCVTELTEQIKSVLLKKGLSVRVSGRRKHLYSLQQEMRNSHLTFDEVQDFIAFRVITNCVADCYASLSVIQSEWEPLPERFKDFIALPKSNKYQSLHTTVIEPGNKEVEIQIRTDKMHTTAEYGVAAHWLYKEHLGGVDPKDVARFAWLRQLTEFQRAGGDAPPVRESLPFDPFPEDVYVLTPKGDVKNFPRGATPIDFAYAVQTDLGHHCGGAWVNGTIVPLRYKLQNGDEVHILTHKSNRPSEHWLELVVTCHAESRIRAYLCVEDQPKAVRQGHDLLDKEMHRHKISPLRFWTSQHAKDVLDRLDAGNAQQLYARIGIGDLSMSAVMNAIRPQHKGRLPKAVSSITERPVRVERHSSQTDQLSVEGMNDVPVRLAKCCTPIPGDIVVGWITHSRVVSVHKQRCPSLVELDPEHRVQVSWDEAFYNAVSGRSVAEK